MRLDGRQVIDIIPPGPEKRTAKSDPIFRNRLVNMVVNRIMKDGKKIIGLSTRQTSWLSSST
jgi:ribosomal protein S7